MMNALLLSKDEFIPITNDRNTFADCSLTRDFELLTFQEKLQVINDIVRQTVLVEPIPNPKDEIETMKGDSYTASLVFIRYLKELEIGKNHRVVLAKKRSFDTENFAEIRFLVLVEDDDNTVYQVDCSTFVGYKCGKVAPMSTPFYEEYFTIEGEVKDTLTCFRTALYDSKYVGSIDGVRFQNLIERMEEHEILEDYAKYFHLAKYSKTGINAKEREEQLYLINSQISIWNEELQDLISSDKDYIRQLELAQSITYELKKLGVIPEIYFEFEDRKIPFSSLNPRFFYENKLTLVMIKPSAYLSGVQNTIRETFLNRGNGAIGDCFVNIGTVSELGLHRMRLFHPHGYKYERSMNGPNRLFLIREKADIVLRKKRELRNTLVRNMHNKDVEWFDGETIFWDPIITNLVHSTDNPSETSLHFVSPYPEHQLMNRFMYPNLKMQF